MQRAALRGRCVWVLSAVFAALCLFGALLVTPALAVDEAGADASADKNGATQTSEIELSADNRAARFADGSFGITDFSRLNKGTNKTYEGEYFGYRFPMAGPDAFVALVLDETHVLIYLPSEQAERVLAPSDTGVSGGPSLPERFITLLEALDEAAASGGSTLAGFELQSADYRFVSEPFAEWQGYRYDFAREVEPGYFYATVTLPGSEDGSSGALFALSGRLVEASEVSLIETPHGLAAVAAFFSSLDARPFWVSLKTSAVAMLFVFVLGLAAAVWSNRISTRLKGVLDSIFTIPMVLPPTVCGFLLLVAFGNSTALGRWLTSHGIELVFSWPAAVLAAIVVSFPLMYRTARGAFEALDPALGDAARTLGWSERRIFLRLTMPLAWPSVAAGTVLAFARAMGEFGATLFVAGNYPGVTQTMPIAIYFQWMGGHPQVAAFWVVVVILISFVVILLINWYAARTQRYRRASVDELDTDKARAA
ncbi:MAG: molybdate ABC transporter permease subunit [Coriobacteriales bacterium]|jgi:molybdate transport system permease protein|nr:molybdate ABC transporter permease subunit [Coriobacteriales bacterium]